MTEEPEEKPFAVERAKSGRAKCKKCKCPIEKDAVRIAKLMANPFGDGKMKAWHHVQCLFDVFAKQRSTTKRIDDPEEDISGWGDLLHEDKRLILDKLRDFQQSAPPTPKGKKNACAKETTKGKSKSPKSVTTDTKISTEGDRTEESECNKEKVISNINNKDNLFREFRRLCTNLENVDAYTEKTAIVKRMFERGTSGDGFKSDVALWCKLLLPQAAKRIYNLQSKQLVKLFARIFVEEEESMLEHLEQGDVAETIHAFFERSNAVTPASKSLLTIQEVDRFLKELSYLTRENEQIQHFKTIIPKCTGNDLKMIIRLIKHDLRINAGPKHILSAIHEDAYKAYQVSMDLDAVIKRCLNNHLSSFSGSSGVPQATEILPGPSQLNQVCALSLMTPVLPMLAEACKSIEMAMKKCPNGMLAEVKYDGERVQVHKRGSEFRYFSRSLKPVVPHKVKLFKDFIPKAFPDGDDLILDSEVLLIDSKTGKPLPFGSLGVHKKSEFKDANVCLFIFDCIYYNGDILMNKTMRERRNILKERITEIPNRIVLSEVQEINNSQKLAELIGSVLKKGLEGLVLKDVNSKYEPGKRHWLKVKKDYLLDGAMADTADLVVLGAWYGTGQKGGLMSIFLMGCYDENSDKWLTVTKVHSGHDDSTLLKLQKQLDMIKISRDPKKVPNWLVANKPMVPDFVAKDPKKQPVWEITGAEFTNQGVHTADGISIRFPRVTKIRDDKDWTTATKLSELRELFRRSSESIDLSLLLGPTDRKIYEDKMTAIESNSSLENTDLDETDINNCSRKKRKYNASNSEDESESKIKVEGCLESPKEQLIYVSPPKSERKKKRRKSAIPEKERIHISDATTLQVQINEGETINKREQTVNIEGEEKREEEEEEKDVTRNKGKFSRVSADINMKKENDDSVSCKYEKKSRAKYYSFIGKDYIEYSEAGSPLNWVEGRKPERGLPSHAKPLSEETQLLLKEQAVFRDIYVSFAPEFKKDRRKHIKRTLKTLGATILKDADKWKSTHVIHDCREISSALLQNFDGVAKSARHVNVSWVEESAASSRVENVYPHVVKLLPNYCVCSRAR